MGKGDKKSGKGKRFKGTYGKTRQPVSKKKNQATLANLKKKVAADKKAAKAKATEEKATETKKAAPKKPSAKKAPAKKAAAKK